MKQISLGASAVEISNKTTRKRVFLEEINIVVPWAEPVRLIQPHAPAGRPGRPPFGLEALLCIHFMQQWFTLSNPAIKSKEAGFARDQIRDLQAWYQALTTPSGHLATAFNTLYAVARETFTFTFSFNGAGISRVDSGTTRNALGPSSQRTSPLNTIKSIATQACKTRASGRFSPKNKVCKALAVSVRGAA